MICAISLTLKYRFKIAPCRQKLESSIHELIIGFRTATSIRQSHTVEGFPLMAVSGRTLEVKSPDHFSVSYKTVIYIRLALGSSSLE